MRSTTVWNPGQQLAGALDPMCDRAIEERWRGCRAMFNDGTVFPARAYGTTEVRIPSVKYESLQLLSSIVDSSDDAILSATLQGSVMSWNRGAERIFGYTAQEIMGKPLMLLRGSATGEDLQRRLAQIGHREECESFETVRRCKSGKQIAVSVTMSPLRDAANRIFGVAEISRDVTDRKQAERNDRIHERLRAMAHLASRLAHDINNPLTGVTNLLFLLEKEALSPQCAHYVSQAHRELRRVARISAHALNLHHITSEPESISIHELADDAISGLEDRCQTMGIYMVREYRVVPMIRCYAVELRQVLTNLVANAVDSMPSGGRLRLRICECSDWVGGGRCLRIWDGNEVWLVAAGGTLYFAFPLLYASAFSGFYLPLMIVLWLLILRGIGIELRSRFELDISRDFFDVIFSVGSGLLAFFFGVALANVIRGVPLRADHFFFLPLWTNFHPGPQPGILDWYTTLCGLLALVALAEHGAFYLAVKTEGVLQQRARYIAKRLWPLLASLTALSLAATIAVHPPSTAAYLRNPVGFLFPAAVVAGLGMMLAFTLSKQDVKAFVFSTVYLAAMLLGAAFALYPVVMPSTLGSAQDLTIVNTEASRYGLSVGLIWWGVGIGIAVAYFIFVYWMFRGHVRTAPPSGPRPVGESGHE